MSIFLVSSRLRWSLPLLLALAVPAWAQEKTPATPRAAKTEAKPPATKSAPPVAANDSQFAQLMTQWKKIVGEMKVLREKYLGATTDAEKKELEDQFNQLRAQGSALAPKLEAAAVAEYKAAPNADLELAEFLLLLADGKVQQEQYEAAQPIVQLLVDNGFEKNKFAKNPANYVFVMAGKIAYALGDWDAAFKYLKRASDERLVRDRSTANWLRTVSDETVRSDFAKGWKREQELRAAEAKADDLPRVKLSTSAGDIVVELFENEAPNTVANFVKLVQDGFYDGTPFHRVIPGFMAQGGDPEGTGTGGPGYSIDCECYRDDHRQHFRGTLSMAHSGKDTGGSQFFLTFVPTTHLDGRHTAFGRVIEGMDVLSKIKRTENEAGVKNEATPDKIVKATVVRKRDHAYKPLTKPEP